MDRQFINQSWLRMSRYTVKFS